MNADDPHIEAATAVEPSADRAPSADPEPGGRPASGDPPVGTFDEELPRATTPVDSMPTGLLGRMSRASGLLRGMASSAIGSRLRGSDSERSAASRAEMAERMYQTLGSLRGGYLKVGQMLSYMGSSLSPEIREALERLQAAAPPMSFETMSEVFEEDFGEPIRSVFPDIDPQHVAAASLGQVYRANAPDGRPVAIKIQYPDVKAAFDSDTRVFGMMIRMTAMTNSGFDTAGLVRELKARMSEEYDYAREARSQQIFYLLTYDDPMVRVPFVYEELCRPRVLVTEWLEGRSFRRFLRESTQEQRDWAGLELWRFSMQNLAWHGIFNADPHPGNYRFPVHKGIDHFDFGCVVRPGERVIRLWRRSLRALLDEDEREWLDSCRELEMIKPKAKDAAGAFHSSVRFFEPFLSDDFRVSEKLIAERLKEYQRSAMNRSHGWLWPAHLLFVNRVQLGLIQVIGMLSAKAPFRSVLEECLARPYEPLDEDALLGEYRDRLRAPR